MATYNEATVTVSRSHFDLLVRRAQFNADSLNTDPTTVPVSQDEYEHLKLVAQKYANLSQNLIRGGTDEATIALLSTDLSVHQNNEPESTVNPSPIKVKRDIDGGAPLNFASQSHSIPPTSNGLPRRPVQSNGFGNGFGSFHQRGGHRHTNDNYDSFEAMSPDEEAELYTDEPVEVGHGQYNHDQQNLDQQQGGSRQQFERDCARSVQLFGLPDGVDHADITNVVRGGPLLDVYLRFHEHTCAISFLRASDARAFFDHVKKNDLYIKNKRVDIRWAKNQFTLPGHVASKIGAGATRNLIIRRVDPRLTEEAIRDDLEHIHNLVVIKVEFRGSSCYIRTNAVHNAMFARTCMMSRLKYKGSKIEWDVDECAQPLETTAPAKKWTQNDAPTGKKPATKAFNPMANRFHLLDIGDEDEEEDISTTFQRAKGRVGVTA